MYHFEKIQPVQHPLKSIQKRHTYGGTDNVIVDCWANGHFMGDEFETKERPSLKLTIIGKDGHASTQRQLRRLGLNGAVRFTGRIETEELLPVRFSALEIAH